MAEPPNIATTMWPLPTILACYQRAIEEGCIRFGPLGGEKNYKSFAAAFYRARREKDKKHDLYIQPSFHLVTVTWEPERDSALIIYDKLPDGMNLPQISSVEGPQLLQARTEQRPQPLLAPPAEPESDAVADQPDFNSAEFVAGLLSKVKIGGDGDSEQGEEVT